MTREQYISAVFEMIRDCGRIKWGLAGKWLDFKFVGEECAVTITNGEVVVWDEDGYQLLKDYAPFEIQGIYEALLDKYKK